MVESHAPRFRLLSSSLSSVVLRAVAAVAAFGVNVLVARALSVSEFGVYALGITWLTLAPTLACFGTDVVAMRFIASSRPQDGATARGVATWGARTALRLGGAVGLASVLYALFWQPETASQGWSLALLFVALPAVALAQTQTGVLLGLGRVVPGIFIERLARPLGLGLALSVVYALAPEWRLLATFLGLVFTQFTTVLLGSRWIRSTLTPITYDGAAARGWRQAALPIAMTSVLGAMSANLDTLLIGAWQPAEAAGIYRAASQLAALVGFALTSSNAVVAPVISRLYAGGQLTELQRTLRLSVGFVGLVGSGVTVALSVFGDHALGLFGTEFTRGFGALQVLLVGQAVNALCGPTGNVMNMTGHQRQAFWAFLSSALVSALLAVTLIPRYGIVGAAWANTAAQLVWNVTLLAFIRSKLRIDPSILGWIWTPRLREKQT